MMDSPKRGLQALFAFGIALLAPGACGTTRPFHFEPVMASALLALLLLAAFGAPMIGAKRKMAGVKACAQQRTGTS